MLFLKIFIKYLLTFFIILSLNLISSNIIYYLILLKLLYFQLFIIILSKEKFKVVLIVILKIKLENNILNIYIKVIIKAI